jgi:hypothetical protein
MALKGEINKVKDGETEKEIFDVEFSNGTLEQLKELKCFLVKEGIVSDTDKLEKVIEVAIAFLERARIDKNQESK